MNIKKLLTVGVIAFAGATMVSCGTSAVQGTPAPASPSSSSSQSSTPKVEKAPSASKGIEVTLDSGEIITVENFPFNELNHLIPSKGTEVQRFGGLEFRGIEGDKLVFSIKYPGHTNTDDYIWTKYSWAKNNDSNSYWGSCIVNGLDYHYVPIKKELIDGECFIKIPFEEDIYAFVITDAVLLGDDTYKDGFIAPIKVVVNKEMLENAKKV